MEAERVQSQKVEGWLGTGMQGETNTRAHKENQGREDGWDTSQTAEKHRKGRDLGKDRGED